MYDVICLSHLRWNFVFQRPQQLLTRCAADRRVFFVEEPIFDEAVGAEPRLQVSSDPSGVHVVVPHLPPTARSMSDEIQSRLLLEMTAEYELDRYVLWFYTPMALPITRELSPLAIVYDCMDELSGFKGAPPELLTREASLLDVANVVFTGGHALYEAKRNLHRNIHPFPSSVDRAHFSKARQKPAEPADQVRIPGPRLGFFGVLDERLDIALLEAVAKGRPDWQFVLLGPVVKIDPAGLPRRPNLHYLGSKPYAELPSYIAHWDVALLLFAKNDATRYISPTKTPEYLAAGKPVVSTSIRDVVRPYSVEGLARIADTPADFINACAAALAEPRERLLPRADRFLSKMSWDTSWAGMAALVDLAVADANARARGFTITREVG